MTGAGAIVLAIAAAKLLVYFYTGRHYGHFVDELYYLACSRHLDWGYVDQPPLIALVTWLWRSMFGQSLAAIRLLPALAGVAEVVLTALIARELGGKRFAQALAALATLVAPGILGGDGLLTMNAFEPLFWMGCAYLLIRLIKTENEKLWIWFGVLAGFGLENKYSMLIFGAGLVLGLLLTPQRRLLASRWLWVGGAIAFLIFLPNLLWNIQHHFPFLELQANIRASGRDVPLGPVAFFVQEILLMLPLTLPIWLGGIWFYFFTQRGKAFSRDRMGVDFHRGGDRRSEPESLLLVSRVPGFIRGRRRAVGAVAGAAEMDLAQVCVSGLDAVGRRRTRAARDTGAAAGNVHSIHASDRVFNSPGSRLPGSGLCRRFSRINSDGTRWRRRWRVSTTLCRRMFARARRSSRKATGRREPSICSVQSTVCRRPSARTRAIFFGALANTPAKA